MHARKSDILFKKEFLHPDASLGPLAPARTSTAKAGVNGVISCVEFNAECKNASIKSLARTIIEL